MDTKNSWMLCLHTSASSTHKKTMRNGKKVFLLSLKYIRRVEENEESKKEKKIWKRFSATNKKKMWQWNPFFYLLFLRQSRYRCSKLMCSSLVVNDLLCDLCYCCQGVITMTKQKIKQISFVSGKSFQKFCVIDASQCKLKIYGRWTTWASECSDPTALQQ